MLLRPCRFSILLTASCLLTVSGPHAQKTVKTEFVSPDTPIVSISTGRLMPWESKKQRSGTYGPDAELTLDDDPISDIDIDGLHKLSNPGQWLFSVATPANLAALISERVDHNTVVRFDGVSGFTRFFCGSTTTDPIPQSCNVDAIYLVGDDDSDLVISLDQCGAPIRGVTYEASDLVRYTRDNPTDCNSWSVVGLQFDASGRIPNSSNVIGATRAEDSTVLSFDIATTVATSGGEVQFIPGQLVRWDGVFFSLYDNLPGWPPNRQVNALTLPADNCVGLGDSNSTDGIVDLCAESWSSDEGARLDRIEWRAEIGATEYNVYRSVLNGTGSFECQTPEHFTDRQYVTTDTPPSGSVYYYLVSAVGSRGEGSLGNTEGVDRPNSKPCGVGTTR